MSQTFSTTKIDRIRTASRTIVRELGFMSQTLAGTSLSPSGVHSILEIGLGTVKNAGELAMLLALEKSTISRLLAKLSDQGLVMTTKDSRDNRIRVLALTDSGWQEFHRIESFARKQVRSALGGLPARTQNTISQGLTAYAEALQHDQRRDKPWKAAAQAMEICSGYFPTLLARVVEMHAAYYSQHYGFGPIFERKVATEMAEFLGRSDSSRNATFSAWQSGRILGAVSIDGEDLGKDIAHLRWFIVDDTARGQGIGKKLLAAAMSHVDQYRFAETQLWTFKGLDAARHIYEQEGFVLRQENPGQQWGTEVFEQLFVRLRN